MSSDRQLESVHSVHPGGHGRGKCPSRGVLLPLDMDTVGRMPSRAELEQTRATPNGVFVDPEATRHLIVSLPAEIFPRSLA